MAAVTCPTESENQPLVTDDVLNSASLSAWRRSQSLRAFLRVVGSWARTNLLLILTLVSVVAGIILGFSIRQAEPGRVWIELLALPGELFLRMLKMLILPLIVFSLLAGLGSLDVKLAGTLGWRTVAYYLTTTVVAVVLGLTLVLAIGPGRRGSVDRPCDNSSFSVEGHELDTLDAVLDLLRNVFPDNLFVATFKQSQTTYSDETVTSWKECLQQYDEPFTNCSAAVEAIESLGLDCHNATKSVRSITVGTRDGMNVLGIILFTIVFAIFLSRTGERGRPIVEAIATLNEVVMSIVRLIMWYSPIGIASIIIGKLLEVEDFSALVQQIGLYMATVLLGLLIHGCVILPLLYLILTRSNPLKLLKNTVQALLTAFGTSSSAATLPVTIQCLEEKAGIDVRVTRFMLPVGATINMDGTALYEAVAVVFIAQVENLKLDFVTVVIICITATAASIGAASVPNAGLVTMVIVLVAVGLPPDDVVLLLPVDWLLDRFRTTVNVFGDCFGAGIVYHYSKKYLDSHTYTSSRPPPSTSSPPRAGTTSSQHCELIDSNTPHTGQVSDTAVHGRKYLNCLLCLSPQSESTSEGEDQPSKTDGDSANCPSPEYATNDTHL